MFKHLPKILFAIYCIAQFSGLHATHRTKHRHTVPATAVEQNVWEQYLKTIKQAKASFYQDLMNQSWGAIAQKYITELGCEEAKLLSHRQLLDEISPAQWKNTTTNLIEFNKINHGFPVSGKIVPQEIQKRTKRFMEGKGLKALFGQVKYMKHGSSMGMTPTAEGAIIFYFDENLINCKTGDLELMLLMMLPRILHTDWIYISSLKRTNKELADRYEAFSFKRADILACLANPNFALWLINTLNTDYPLKMIGHCITKLVCEKHAADYSSLAQLRRTIAIYSEIQPQKPRQTVHLRTEIIPIASLVLLGYITWNCLTESLLF